MNYFTETCKKCGHVGKPSPLAGINTQPCPNCGSNDYIVTYCKTHEDYGM